MWRLSENLTDYDFTQLQVAIDDIFVKKAPDFKDIVSELMQGNMGASVKTVFSALWQSCVAELTVGRRAVLLLLGLGIMAAVFYNISLAFQSRQIADTGFLVTYLAFLSITVLAFQESCQIAAGLLENLETFMKALIPAFFISVTVTAGSASAVGFYKVMLILMSLADTFLLGLILPVIKLATVVMLINYVTREEMLSRLAKLFQTVVSWSLKGTLTIVAAVNTMQGLMLPSIDGMKLSVLQKTMSMLPGIGNSAEAAAGLVAQSGQMIKNGIGVAALLFTGVIVAVPVIKLGVLILMYQMTCAMLQPVTDKRMVEALAAVCEGCKNLLQLVATAGILYMVTLAVVCMVT